MIAIETFDNQRGGNVIYKALAHPLAAELGVKLAARLSATRPVAWFDPANLAPALAALYPALPIDSLFVQDIREIGDERLMFSARPVTELAASDCRAVLVVAFDAGRIVERLRAFLPAGTLIESLDALRLPVSMLTNPRRYLDPLNFATNFAFFRDQGGFSTRLVTANYWAGYGARALKLWLRLFDEEGKALASWEEEVPASAGAIVIDSAQVRLRFSLPSFTGQLFLHVIGAAGHDVVKYALDTYGTDGQASLSCTHDANSWPADFYAGLPAPRSDERVILWLQNSHAAPIPPGAIALDRMGAEAPVPFADSVPGFASRAIDVARLLPGITWPAQIELRAGRHVVRPRYEVERGGRVRIAHVNVERTDLKPDRGIESLSNHLGRGFLLPFPVLPRRHFRSIVLPNPMARSQRCLPLRLDVFDPEGREVASHFLGCLPRDHALALDLDEVLAAGELEEGGHAELVYDFRAGGEADGWLHALMRYEDRLSGHAAETSFGAHCFNTLLTYKGEPQSYAGPPPGLSTRLFLRLGSEGRESFAVLIYPASSPWHARSQTRLVLHDASGTEMATEELAIACSGSIITEPHAVFGGKTLARAGEGAYVLVRDTTCRLFGYHGLKDGRGGFSLDHMFGF